MVRSRLGAVTAQEGVPHGVGVSELHINHLSVEAKNIAWPQGKNATFDSGWSVGRTTSDRVWSFPTGRFS
jgi:hypothetical protein